MKEPRRCTQQPPERVNADETLIQSSSATKGAVAPPSPSSVLPPGDVVLGIAAIVGKAAFFLVGSTFLGLRASPRFFRWLRSSTRAASCWQLELLRSLACTRSDEPSPAGAAGRSDAQVRLTRTSIRLVVQSALG